MDKLRDFFRAVKRIHFWLICGLVTVLSLVFWFLSVGQLAKDTQTQKSKIEGLFSKNWHGEDIQLFSGNWITEYTEMLLPERSTHNFEVLPE